MKIYKEWSDIAYKEMTKEESDKFWTAYLEKEKNVYEKILAKKDNVITGTVSELAKKYDMDLTSFAGFIDGINTSLIKEVNLEELEEESNITLDIDFEKLYYNMLDAKAPWLYELPEWEEILSAERRKEITKEYRRSKIVTVKKIGRNEPCPCGSGKKYKKCCGK
ncbi:SEC-C domain-containing protein [Gottschalkia purinilytica]|uniref:SEC-C domain-containing protein n=1 Tax=Gottschalkia purinilytica TaxID=1503 RepID=A0A0L0WEJ7_GOTPU|nr:SEC-C metal-binding domain-containing protein [Gottschalkia purinilytica]KNF09903.1 SEC-C domain-containing protein [Gottschalkia purinilytica]